MDGRCQELCRESDHDSRPLAWADAREQQAAKQEMLCRPPRALRQLEHRAAADGPQEAVRDVGRLVALESDETAELWAAARLAGEQQQAWAVWVQVPREQMSSVQERAQPVSHRLEQVQLELKEPQQALAPERLGPVGAWWPEVLPAWPPLGFVAPEQQRAA